MTDTYILMDIITDHNLCKTQKETLQSVIDKIEQGTLIELPCKVGNDAYFVISHEKDGVMEIGYVTAISIDKDGIWLSCLYDSGLSYWHKSKDKNLFFNANEAEKRLKELQNG